MKISFGVIITSLHRLLLSPGVRRCAKQLMAGGVQLLQSVDQAQPTMDRNAAPAGLITEAAAMPLLDPAVADASAPMLAPPPPSPSCIMARAYAPSDWRRRQCSPASARRTPLAFFSVKRIT